MSRQATIVSAICSGVPTQNVSSSATSAIGVRLSAMHSSQARVRRLGLSRMIGLQPTVRWISRWSRPTASQCARSTASLWRSFSMVPMAFHWSAYFATVRSVFLSPEPPIMIGRRAGPAAAPAAGRRTDSARRARR